MARVLPPFILLLCIVSCGAQDESAAFMRRTFAKYPEMADVSWTILSHYSDGAMTLVREDGDTTYVADIQERYTETSNSNELLVAITKAFQQDNLQHHVVFDGDSRLLYHYYFDKTKTGFVFVEGEYKFKYENGFLSKGQQRYYRLHSDSLCLIHGNDLPPLPEIKD